MNNIVPILFVLCAIIFLDPLMVLMPSELIYVVEAVFFVLFGFYASVVWQERTEDERDMKHKMSAGHLAYLVGAIVAGVGILYQAIILHTVDLWLVLVLVAMVVAKTVYRKHLHENN